MKEGSDAREAAPDSASAKVSTGLRAYKAASGAADVLAPTLELAVRLQMLQVRGKGPRWRRQVAAQAALVTGAQGDKLQFGSRHEYGHGLSQLERHLAAAPRDGRCPDGSCWCSKAGTPAWSAGEVFDRLALGLACAAFEPGGVTFAGVHWCADHRQCEAGMEGAQ